MRKANGLGLRELAHKASLSPAFLSKIESGKEKPPAEKKVRALAKALRCDADVLMAEAGRLPADIVKIVQKCPREYLALLRDLRNLNAKQLAQVRTRIPITRMDIPVSPEELEKFRQLWHKGSVGQIDISSDADEKNSSPQDSSNHENNDAEEVQK